MSRAHPRRSAARRTSSSSGKGASIKMLPGWYGGPARWPSANTARRTRRLAGIRRMWPSHWCLRVRTAVRRSYEGVVASSRYDLPVMRCSCRELNPFSVASALGVRIHASLPCVIPTHQQPVGVGQHCQLRLGGHLTLTSIIQQPHTNTPTAGRPGATLSA